MTNNKPRFRLQSLFIVTAGTAIALTACRLWPLDGWLGIFCGNGDTVWATGYSDNRWRSIHAGMTREEVYAVLGPPLEIRLSPTLFDFDTPRQNPGEVVECWTRTPNNGSYSIRQLVFKGDDVVDKINEFYID